MDAIWRYFDLSARGGITVTPDPISLPWQLALYGVLILGILANGILVAIRTHRRYRFQWRKFVVSAIIALAIFPAVYEGARANLDKPTLVQLALIFSSGLGYESLFSGVVSLAEGKK